MASGRLQSDIFHDVTDKLEGDYNLVILAESIQRDIKDEAISLRNLLIYQDEAMVQREIATIKELNERITENIEMLRSHASTEEQTRVMTQLSNAFTELNQYEEQLIVNVLAGRLVDATTLMNDNYALTHDKLQDMMADLTMAIEQRMQSSLENEKGNITTIVIIEVIVLSLLTIIIIVLLFRTVWSLTSRLNRVSKVMSDIAKGKIDLTTEVEVIDSDEIDGVAESFNRMTASLEEKSNIEQEITWTKSNIAHITSRLSGTKTVESLAEIFLSETIPIIGGSHAVFYIIDDKQEDNTEDTFTLRASYALKEKKDKIPSIRSGEGLIGQCAFEKRAIILSDVPRDYLSVESGLGEATPLTLYLFPILFEGEVKGVIEIASFRTIEKKELTLLEELTEELGIVLENVIGRIRQARLLKETQIQSEKLRSQQEVLKRTNVELEKQTVTLRQSEEELQVQQQEIEETNVELEEKSQRLEKQNKLYVDKNNELEKAKGVLEEQARELALSSKYKSEFLANMSHELRTPLNSMLILSNLLADNKDGTLTTKQVEFAQTIHSSGKDLLALISDILDLSKIESGKMEVYPSQVPLADLVQMIESNFRPVANDKNVGFDIVLQDDLPELIYTDAAKLQQILKNLLANAFKFTKQGKVRLEVSHARTGGNKPIFKFSVKDTGIGIAKESQKLIFNAFQQEDGTTSREYGGTGLGLSISKEISTLIGAEITLKSEEGKGSTFSLLISDYKDETQEINEKEAEITVEADHPDRIASLINKRSVEENSHIQRVLIVDDDLKRRNNVMELLGDMDVILRAVSTGTEVMNELRMNTFDYIILGLGLSDMKEFTWLENIKSKYDALKILIYTDRNITEDEVYLRKYVDNVITMDQHLDEHLKDKFKFYLNEKKADLNNITVEIHSEQLRNRELEGRRVLLVDDDIRNIYALSSILEEYGMDIFFAENGLEALDILKEDQNLDLIIMDIMMPAMDGYETMRRIRKMATYMDHPIIALTAKAMKGDREKSLEAGASDYIMKPVDTEQLLSLIKVWLFRREGEAD